MEIKSLPTVSLRATDFEQIEAVCKSDLFLLDSRKNRILRLKDKTGHTRTAQKIQQIKNAGELNLRSVVGEIVGSNLIRRYEKFHCDSIKELTERLAVERELRNIVDRGIVSVSSEVADLASKQKKRSSAIGSSQTVHAFLTIVDLVVEQYQVIRDLKKKVEELLTRSEIAKNERLKVSELESELRSLRDASRDDAQRANESIEATNRAMKELQTKLKTTEETRHAIEQESVALRKALDAERMRAEDLSRREAESKRAVESLRNEMASRNERASERATEDADARASEVERLTSELASIRRERDDAVASIDQAKRDHTSTIEASQRMLEAHRKEIVALKSRVSSLKRDNEGHATERARLDAQHRRHMDEQLQLSRSLQKEITDLKSTADHRERRLDALLKTASAGDKSFEEVFQEEFSAMREAYEMQLARLRDELGKERAKSRAEIRGLSGKHEEAARHIKKEVEDLRFDVNLLREKLASYENSDPLEASKTEASEATRPLLVYRL